jgi:hypothetical protein
MTRAAARPADAASKPARKPVKGYFLRSELPWTSLVFLLPFLVVYEVGTRYYTADSDIRAFKWMQDFFEFFHAYGRHLPALAVIGVLLAWHIARRDDWSIAPPHLLGMLFESFLLAIPVILLAQLASRYMPLLALRGPLTGKIVLSVGAGIYEELVFRLAAFALLSLIFVDVLGMRKGWAHLLMVLISSVGFSLYHYWGFEQFRLQSFAFRTAAGVYFSLVFIYRGFGISAGAHSAYDIVVNLLSALA